MDVTCWLAWFLGCLLRVIEGADATVGAVRGKSQFWQRWSGVALNERQIRLLNRLLNGFDGKLTSGKRAALRSARLTRHYATSMTCWRKARS